MVSEGSKNVVMVYTKDLTYVRQFGSNGNGPGQFKDIRGVSSDDDGNLYISDYERRCVQVFSSNGKFLHSISQGRGAWGELSHPIGICVAGQYLYVAEWKAHCVSVFTTKGEYVASFGQQGSGEGKFNHPRGLHVDKDGLCMSVIVTITYFKYSNYLFHPFWIFFDKLFSNCVIKWSS